MEQPYFFEDTTQRFVIVDNFQILILKVVINVLLSQGTTIFFDIAH
jgi:hypothetical protein